MAAIWARVNTILLVLLLLAVLSLIAMYATRAYGGPLDPPLAPGSTDSVRLPGTPISSAPYTIASPGHYYLTRNLSITGAQVAITIAADGVSLDLGGFTIDGDDTTGSFGIQSSGDRHDIIIANGTVRDFHFGMDLGALLNRDLTVRGVNAVSNIRGLSLVGINIVLTDCTAYDNTETGVYVAGDHGVIRQCSASNNDVDGIAVAGNRQFVESNASTNNNGVDINVTGGANNVVRDSNAGSIVLASNLHNVAIDNWCLVLTGAGGTNITAATSHQNVGC